jgi:hypothetical protein
MKLQKPANAGPNSKPELTVDPCAQCSGVSEDYERANITKYGNMNDYSSVWVSLTSPECRGLD